LEIIIGFIVGIISGLLGIGGGIVLVPILTVMSYTLTQAISISIFTMLITSLFGSVMNFHKDKTHLKDGIIIGLGAFIGGTQSTIIQHMLKEEYMWYIMLSVLFFSLLKLLLEPPLKDIKEGKNHNLFLLFVIGFLVSLLGMSLGIGGAIILVPLLITILKYDLKSATELGLLYILFASFGAFISQIIDNNIYLKESLIITFFSILGLIIGTKIKKGIDPNILKNMLLGLNLLLIIVVITKII